jgi:hypothetical protein
MTRKRALVQIKNLNNASDVIYTHYIIHRKAMAARKTAPKL